MAKYIKRNSADLIEAKQFKKEDKIHYNNLYYNFFLDEYYIKTLYQFCEIKEGDFLILKGTEIIDIINCYDFEEKYELLEEEKKEKVKPRYGQPICPTFTNQGYSDAYFCGKCDKNLRRELYANYAVVDNFCPNCGVEIDWS